MHKHKSFKPIFSSFSNLHLGHVIFDFLMIVSIMLAMFLVCFI
jgi:hypothetical protein